MRFANVSMRQALTFWSHLEACYYERASGKDSNTKEIYCSTLMPYSPSLASYTMNNNRSDLCVESVKDLVLDFVDALGEILNFFMSIHEDADIFIAGIPCEKWIAQVCIQANDPGSYYPIRFDITVKRKAAKK